MAKKIPLQNGMYAIVDDEDYERLKGKSCYVKYNPTKLYVVVIDKGRRTSLEKFIFKYKKDEAWIPVDGNYLNFKRENGKIINKSERNRYMKARRTNKSKYKGVTWQANRWIAQIQPNKTNIYLGRFENEDDAAIAYNHAAYTVWGEECYINKIGYDNRYDAYDEWIKEGFLHRKNKYGYRGVIYEGEKEKFRFVVYSKDKNFTSKLYDTPLEAAKAYDKKAYELYGDKAILNFPELVEEYKKEIGTNQHQKCTK